MHCMTSGQQPAIGQWRSPKKFRGGAVSNEKKDVPSAIGSRTVRGLGEVISGRSFPHIIQCVEATARTCDLSVHMRQSLPLALGRSFLARN
jgi:hypothetical protein